MFLNRAPQSTIRAVTEQGFNRCDLSIEHGLIKYRSPVTNFVHVPALAGFKECQCAAPIYAYDSLSPLVIYTGALITAPETHHLFADGRVLIYG